MTERDPEPVELPDDPEWPKNDPVPEGGVPLSDGVEPTPPEPTEE